MKNIFNDNFQAVLWPLFRLKPAFAWADGIFSPLKRALLEHKELPDDKKISVSSASSRENAVQFYEDYFQYKNISFSVENRNDEMPVIKPADYIQNWGRRLEADLKYLNKEEYNNNADGIHFKGSLKDLWISKEAEISDMAFIDASTGPVIIEKGAKVSAFSHIEGPVFIGPLSRLDRAYLKNSRIGFNCRIGGEVDSSLFSDFSNKHHEGFIGHSLVADWVNLGALTTTSDLKNNYGKVRLYYQDERFEAETIKFGSIIGDYVKTGIGTMLNTGTVIDMGCLMFERLRKQKYYSPFFWGGENENTYEIEKFLADANTIMKRRGESIHSFIEKYARIFSEKKYRI